MLHQNNNKRVFIARNCDRTSGLTAGNLTHNLGAGEIIIVNESGAIIDTAAKAQAAKSIKIIQGVTDEPPRISDIIRKEDIVSFLSSKFTQKQEKKVVIGYNGATGSIDVIAANVYTVEIDHIYKNPNNPSAFTTRVPYESLISGATQYSIAKGLAQLLVSTYIQFEEGVRVGIISSSAVTTADTILGCEVIEGDTVLSYTSLQGSTPAVGSVVSIPGITGAPHRDEDSTLYEILYIDTVNTFIELDRPYSNRSQSAIDIEPITNIATGDFGLTLEGVSINNIKPEEAMMMTDFAVTLKGFGDTPEEKDTVALAINQGFGRHEAVANAELWFQGCQGRNMYQTLEYQNPVNEVTKNHGYSMIKIMYEHNERLGALETNGQKKEMDIYLDRNTYTLIKGNHADTEFGTNIKVGTGLDTIDGSGVLNVLNAFVVDAGIIATGANTSSNGGKCMTAATTYDTGIDV